MRSPRNASIASALAFGLIVAAAPALAQSSPSGTTGSGTTGSGTMNSGTTGAQGSSSTTGTLPDNSLAGQRQGAMTGGKAPQTGDPSAAPGTSGSSSAAPTGALPDDSLAGQRQGVIGGGAVTQGGSGSTTTPQPK